MPFNQTVAAVYIPENWLDETQVNFEAALQVSKRSKMVDIGGAKKGDIFHIPKVVSLASSAMPETNTDVVDNSPAAPGEVILTLNKSRMCSVYLPKHTNLYLIKYDLRREYTEKIGHILAQDLEDDCLTELDVAENATVGLVTSDITDLTVRNAMKELDQDNIPDMGRMLVFHPSQRNVLLGIADYVRSSSIGKNQAVSPLVTGELLNIYGMEALFSSRVKDETVGADTGHANWLFNKESLVVGHSNPDLEYNYIPLRKMWLLSGDFFYGVKGFRTGTTDGTHVKIRTL